LPVAIPKVASDACQTKRPSMLAGIGFHCSEFAGLFVSEISPSEAVSDHFPIYEPIQIDTPISRYWSTSITVTRTIRPNTVAVRFSRA
jgi:hypothetical protein